MSMDQHVKVGESNLVNVKLLEFDINNPRFTPDKRPLSNDDSAVVSQLATSADLGELVQSIATSGYINIEPLIVIEKGGKLVVLEGNRRSAAIKLLLDPELAREARVKYPDISQENLDSLKEILVYRVAAEDDARDLIGFKHINGPQVWDAFAKARFAAAWLDSEHAKIANGQDGLNLVQIAGRMGDQHMTIHRMITAIYVLEQAEDAGVYDITDRKKNSFSFSHLYTALSYEEFTNFLGMVRPNRNFDPPKLPIKPEKFDSLRLVLVWLYGSKSLDLPPVVKSQNPDLSRLKEVLGSPTAVRVLLERGDLDDAIQASTPKSIVFEQHLINANAELFHAMAAMEGYDAEAHPELVQIAVSLSKKAALIRAFLVQGILISEDVIK